MKKSILAGGRPSRANQAYFQARALPGPGVEFFCWRGVGGGAEPIKQNRKNMMNYKMKNKLLLTAARGGGGLEALRQTT